MTDFAIYHKANWRDGEMPKPEGATHIVSHDTRHFAYDVPESEEAKFFEWVAWTFTSDEDPVFGIDMIGDVHRYFDEVDIGIKWVQP